MQNCREKSRAIIPNSFLQLLLDVVESHMEQSSKLNFSASGFAVFFFWHGIDQNSILEFFFNCQMSSYANSTTLHCKSIQNSGCIDEQWPSHLEGILCVKTGDSSQFRRFSIKFQIQNSLRETRSNLSIFPRKNARWRLYYKAHFLRQKRKKKTLRSVGLRPPSLRFR